MISISGYIMARDEALFLQETLDCLCRLCDEIVVVVDPRSEDGTLGMANAYSQHFAEPPIRVFEHETPYDLSAQRNYALQRCTGDWCLTLDADEVFHPVIYRFWKEFRRRIEEPPETMPDAFGFPRLVLYPDRHNYLHKDGDADPQIKLFRKTPETHYRSRVGGVHHYLYRGDKEINLFPKEEDIAAYLATPPILHLQLLKPDEVLQSKGDAFVEREQPGGMNIGDRDFWCRIKQNPGEVRPLNRYKVIQ